MTKRTGRLLVRDGRSWPWRLASQGSKSFTSGEKARQVVSRLHAKRSAVSLEPFRGPLPAGVVQRREERRLRVELADRVERPHQLWRIDHMQVSLRSRRSR